MIELASRVEEAGGYIISLKVWILRKNLLRRFAGRQEFEYIDDAKAHTPDARPATALLRVKRDSRQKVGFAHRFSPRANRAGRQRAHALGGRSFLPTRKIRT